MIEPKQLEIIITEKRNHLRTDRLDMSFGELINLYEEGTLFINPEYQRSFRWDKVRQTKFIESILLGIPVPPIFIAEDKNAKWELVDGLQRISTILALFGILKNVPETKNNLDLTPGGIVRELEGYTINNLSPLLKFTIKRAVCRVEIIKWDSIVDMRYELFNRLNTLGEPLSEQEIRNCIFRDDGNEFNQILIDIGNSDDFKNIIRPTDKQIDQMYCQELVLRFFTLKHCGWDFVTIQDHMTQFMEKVTKRELSFDFNHEQQHLLKLITYLKQHADDQIFRATNGNFAPAYYDIVMLGLDRFYDRYKDEPDLFIQKVNFAKEEATFDKVATYSSSKRTKQRIETALEILGK